MCKCVSVRERERVCVSVRERVFECEYEGESMIVRGRAFVRREWLSEICI